MTDRELFDDFRIISSGEHRFTFIVGRRLVTWIRNRIDVVDFSVSRIRKHSSGCVVFQMNRSDKQSKGGYKTTTIYIHRLVAEQFLSHEKTTIKNVAGAKDGNKLNCQVSNLCYRSRGAAMRQRKTSSKLGYRGVSLYDGKYRAMISMDRKMIHIGLFPTIEEAAMAYNKKSRELFGENGKINIIRM